MFSKAERLELEELSFEYYGSRAAYQKIARKARVPDQMFERKNQPVYVRGKNGAVMKLTTAIAKGLIKPDKDGKLPDATRTESRATFRELTFEELRNDMTSALEVKRFSAMPPVQMLLTVASRFVARTLINMPYVVVPENAANDFAELLALVPTDRQDEIKKQVVPNGNPKEFCVDGIQLLTDVVFCVTQPDEARNQLDEYDFVSKHGMTPTEYLEKRGLVEPLSTSP